MNLTMPGTLLGKETASVVMPAAACEQVVIDVVHIRKDLHHFAAFAVCDEGSQTAQLAQSARECRAMLQAVFGHDDADRHIT